MKSIAHIPSLTPMRGIAAILVAIFHFHIIAGRLLPEGNPVFSRMYLMVDLFFVLSGFIMMHVYGQNFTSGLSKKKYSNFLIARLARIYPLHLFTFMFILVSGYCYRTYADMAQGPKIFDLITDYTAIPFVLTLTQAWGSHMEATWNSVSWSISVEWMLYLLFPVLVIIHKKLNRHSFWIWGLIGAGLLFFIAYIIGPHYFSKLYDLRTFPPQALEAVPSDSIDMITGPALLRGLGGFLIGMAVYEVYERGFLKKLCSSTLTFILISLLLITLWYFELLLDPLAVLIFGVLILSTAHLDGVGRKVLNAKLFTFLGEVSYSIYLCHMVIFFGYIWICLILKKQPWPLEDGIRNNWIEFLVFISVTIAISTLTYYGIERPARRFIKSKWKE